MPHLGKTTPEGFKWFVKTQNCPRKGKMGTKTQQNPYKKLGNVS